MVALVRLVKLLQIHAPILTTAQCILMVRQIVVGGLLLQMAILSVWLLMLIMEHYILRKITHGKIVETLQVAQVKQGRLLLGQEVA